MQEYDYIIAGGGSAGCVVASRLSEDPRNRVLLIESGRRDTDKYIHIPATFFRVLEKGRDALFYASEPEKGLNGRPSIVPQGQVLGGGSSVNAMVYIRGSRQDYDTLGAARLSQLELRQGSSGFSRSRKQPAALWRLSRGQWRTDGFGQGLWPSIIVGLHTRGPGDRHSLQ